MTTVVALASGPRISENDQDREQHARRGARSDGHREWDRLEVRLDDERVPLHQLKDEQGDGEQRGSRYQLDIVLPEQADRGVDDLGHGAGAQRDWRHEHSRQGEGFEETTTAALM